MSDMTRRSMMAAGASLTLGAMAGPAFGAFPVDRPVKDPLWYVDPELRPAARMVQQMMAQQPAFSLETLAAVRNRPNRIPPPTDAVSIRMRQVPGSRGAPPVTVYVVNAKPGQSRPAILNMHGGGFISGSAKAELFAMQEMALALDCTIVTVEYRLAPETRYSGSIEDNYAALRWTYVNATELGIDPNRIALMGGSAGGGHAALLAITARDRGEVPVLFQALIFPMLDDRTGSSRVVSDHIGTLLWTSEANRFGWRSFLGREPGGASVPAAGVPARVRDVAGLPPTFIGVGSIDLFVQEDIDFAQRLIAAGVATELSVVPGAFHSFQNVARDTLIARRFTRSVQDALRKAFDAGRRS